MNHLPLQAVRQKVLDKIRVEFPLSELKDLPEFAAKIDAWAVREVSEQVWQEIPALLEGGHQSSVPHAVLHGGLHYEVRSSIEPIAPDVLHVTLLPRANTGGPRSRKPKLKTKSAKVLPVAGSIGKLKFTAPENLMLDREAALAVASAVMDASYSWLIECIEAALADAADALATSLYAEMRLILQDAALYECLWFWVALSDEAWYLPDPRISRRALSTLGAQCPGTGDSPATMLGMVVATKMKYMDSLSSGIAKEGRAVSVNLTGAGYIKDLPVFSRTEIVMFGTDLTILPVEVQDSAKLFLGFPSKFDDVLLPRVRASLPRLKRIFATQRGLIRPLVTKTWDWMQRVEWIKTVERGMKLADWVQKWLHWWA